MSIITTWDNETKAVWASFVTEEHLSEVQAHQFARYMELLIEWNQKTNITRIIEPKEIIAFHFRDSLVLARAKDLSQCRGICDVGSGGGFPGIPLAILYPHMLCILLEVSQKKCAFLQAVIDALGLSSCRVESCDYRTFLRTTSYDVDYFIARASLRPDELIRALTAQTYKDATVVYWASRHWEAGKAESRYLAERYTYMLDGHMRLLAFFKSSSSATQA